MRNFLVHDSSGNATRKSESFGGEFCTHVIDSDSEADDIQNVQNRTNSLPLEKIENHLKFESIITKIHQMKFNLKIITLFQIHRNWKKHQHLATYNWWKLFRLILQEIQLYSTFKIQNQTLMANFQTIESWNA